MCTVRSKKANKNIEQRSLTGFITIPALNYAETKKGQRRASLVAPSCSGGEVLYGLYSEVLSERGTFEIRDELKKMKTGREICHLFIYFQKEAFSKCFEPTNLMAINGCILSTVINERYIAWQEYLLLLPKTTMKI